MNDTIRFQATFSYTLEKYKEFCKINLESHTSNTLLCLFAGACMAFLIFMLPYDTSPITVLLLSLLWLGIFLFRYFKSRDGGVEYKRLLHTNNGKIPSHKIMIRDSGIQYVNLDTGKEVLTSFDSVRFIMESKNLLILVDNLKLALVLDKTTLEGGTREDVMSYLREKCSRMSKRVRSGIFGRIVKWILLGLIIIALLASLAKLLKIPEKLSGQMTNDMSYQEMASELEAFDIHISDQAIREIEAFDAEYALESGEYYKENPYASKIYDLLCWEGTGFYDETDFSWTPSTSGVYWFDMEVMYVDTIYSDFFAGVSAMAPELNITGVTEDYSGADFENGTGEIIVTFCLDGTPHTLKADMMYDWMDMNILYDFARLLEQDQDPQSLWHSVDGQGVLLYYGTEEQVKALAQKTGLEFYECIQLNCDH